MIPQHLASIVARVRTPGFAFTDDEGRRCVVTSYDSTFDSIELEIEDFGHSSMEVFIAAEFLFDGTFTPTRPQKKVVKDQGFTTTFAGAASIHITQRCDNDPSNNNHIMFDQAEVNGMIDYLVALGLVTRVQ